MWPDIISAIAGAVVGSVLTIIIQWLSHRLQRMDCYYVEDEILSKIPHIGADNKKQENLYCKRFRIINTTNIDIENFKVIFQFDSSAKLVEYYSQSKEGYDIQKVYKNSFFPNQAEAVINKFNRGDKIDYIFKIANISKNEYYVTESQCTGFKIYCKDKRKQASKSKSNKSNQILVNKPISSNSETE